ncbi:MAG: Hint domain-containing protein, partial [Nanoarchaeota archaeon]
TTNGDIRFRIGSADSVVISNSGNVGIGTTTPASLLELWKPATSTLTITSASSTAADAVLAFRTGASPSENFKLYVDDSDSDKLVIATSTSSNLFTITQAGNVGIGTTSPTQKLYVEGQCVTGDSLLAIAKMQNSKCKIQNDPEGKPSASYGAGNSKCKIEEIEYTRIDQIKGEEYVLSLNEKTGKLEPAKIKGLLDMGVKPIYELETEDGRKIRTTGNHPYFVLKNQKTTSDEMASGRPTDLPIGAPDKFSNSIANQEILSSPLAVDNSQKTVEVGELESPRRYLSGTPGKPATPTASSLYPEGVALQPYRTGQEDIQDATWVKVYQLQVGDQIAVADELNLVKSKVRFERIARIEQLPAEQVYDIEVEGTHNFVANGIIAHNTYISATTTLASGLVVDTDTLFVDSANNRIGVGTTTPAALLDIYGTSNKLRLSYNASNYADFSVGSSGTLTVQTSGTDEDIELRTTAYDNALYIDDSALRVGIGTSTPLGILSVATSTGAIVFQVSDNNRVGIGTTSPTATLELKGTAGVNPFNIASSSGASLMMIN